MSIRDSIVVFRGKLSMYLVFLFFLIYFSKKSKKLTLEIAVVDWKFTKNK